MYRKISVRYGRTGLRTGTEVSRDVMVNAAEHMEFHETFCQKKCMLSLRTLKFLKSCVLKRLFVHCLFIDVSKGLLGLKG